MRSNKDDLGYHLPGPVSELLELIDAEWAAFLGLLETIPKERLTEPGVIGTWSVKDLVGHVALWDEQVVEDIEAYVARKPPLGNPWRKLNTEDHKKNADRSLEEQRARMLTRHDRMRERLSQEKEIDRDMVAI